MKQVTQSTIFACEIQEMSVKSTRGITIATNII